MTQKIQYQQYTNCYSYLKAGQFIMVQDFSKNREIINQDEIKSSWWVKKQVTMHPTVIFYRLQNMGEIHRLVITHLSDILTHDAHLVHHMTLDCIKILKEKHPETEWTKGFLWSDGCASQYKGKNSFFYLDKFPIAVERHFFASEHGKGPSDAETGLISMRLDHAIKSRQIKIQNAEQMCNFLKSNRELNEIYEDIEDNEDDIIYDKRIFKLVKEDDPDLQFLIEKFKGVKVNTLEGNCTRSLHQIKASSDKGFLLQRPFSCFCSNCRAENFSGCLNVGFTEGSFKKVKLPKYEDDIENEIENEEEIEDITQIFDEKDPEDDEVIQLENQNLTFEDLKLESYVVVSVPVEKANKTTTLSHYVAKIVKLQEGEDIDIDFLDQDKCHHEKFKEDSQVRDFQYVTELKNIIMLLPDPQPIRGGQLLQRKIYLKM